jgi:uncharacterized iron-regulated membrane protein
MIIVFRWEPVYAHRFAILGEWGSGGSAAMESFLVPALVAGAFVVGAIVGYGIRAFISARRRARARRPWFLIVPLL